MLERFANLKKIPDEPARRILAARATKLETKLDAPANASVETVLSELAEKEAWVDILRLFSVALPPREAVWWACVAGHDIIKDETTPCLKASEAWVFEPNDKNREQVQIALDAVDMDDDTALVATAALYAPGNMGTGDMAEHPAPPAAVAACVFGINIKTLGLAEDMMLQMHWVIDRAADIARGGNGKVAVPDVDTSPKPVTENDTAQQSEDV